MKNFNFLYLFLGIFSYVLKADLQLQFNNSNNPISISESAAKNSKLIDNILESNKKDELIILQEVDEDTGKLIINILEKIKDKDVIDISSITDNLNSSQLIKLANATDYMLLDLKIVEKILRILADKILVANEESLASDKEFNMHKLTPDLNDLTPDLKDSFEEILFYKVAEKTLSVQYGSTNKSQFYFKFNDQEYAIDCLPPGIPFAVCNTMKYSITNPSYTPPDPRDPSTWTTEGTRPCNVCKDKCIRYSFVHEDCDKKTGQVKSLAT